MIKCRPTSIEMTALAPLAPIVCRQSTSAAASTVQPSYLHAVTTSRRYFQISTRLLNLRCRCRHAAASIPDGWRHFFAFRRWRFMLYGALSHDTSRCAFQEADSCGAWMAWLRIIGKSFVAAMGGICRRTIRIAMVVGRFTSTSLGLMRALALTMQNHQRQSA